MIELFAALQPVLVGVVLLWSARVKLVGRHAAAAARRSALVPLLGQRRALPAYRLVGGLELVVGALLVLPPVSVPEALAAAGLTIGFLAYLGYARVAAPESSCGCLSAQRAPVTVRALLRAGALFGASLLAAGAGDSWWAALTQRPLAAVALLTAEALLIVALSAELDRFWLVPLRQLRVRLTHPLRGGFGVPLLATVQQLQRSGAYRRVSALLSSDVREHWDEGEWRMVCHAARYQGRPATVVFAVPLRRFAPESVRVAVVDDATGTVLWRLAGADEASRPPSTLTLRTT
ncbi:MAG TPA: MauE/DoxX family redox-associated membrane protein [Micromonosporaceae bacterium]